MHRKQFLRTAAIALPAALMAPELLLATGNTPAAAATKQDFVVINGATSQTGVIKTPGSGTQTVNAGKVTGILFAGGHWLVTLQSGASYLTQKLVINGAGCEVTGENTVQITGVARPQDVNFAQGRNLKAAKRQEKENTPQVWMHSHEKLDAHVFDAFLRKARPVLLYVD